MSEFLSYTVFGLFTGAAYAIAASGLVLTYSTTRVFNIGHGAVGMFFGFLYWDFSQKQGMPAWLSILLVLFVFAPLLGVFIERVVARGLGNAPISVSLVVTVAILVILIGAATVIWPAEPRNLPYFYDGHPIKLDWFGENNEVIITWHQLITVVVSGVVALLLWLLLARTRIGVAMRASVDNPDLLRLYGGRPQLVASLAWAIGTSLGALAGILLTPVVGLQYYDLALLVISAYAAAMLGKLTSLPMTYLGAMLVGLAGSYVIGYSQKIPFADDIVGLPAVIPTAFLFAILVLMPQAPLRIGQVKGLVVPPVPTLGRSAAVGGGLLAAVAVVVLSGQPLGLSTANQLLLGVAATFAIVMLSLVLLTGYGAFVSLAQFTFAGVGAVVYAQIDQPNLFGLLVATVTAAAVGAAVAIPVLRLTGLYLGLATLAFAQLMDKLVFQSAWGFEFNNALNAERLSILGNRINDTGKYVLMMFVFFVLIALVVIAVRRGRLGRMLIATRDSQAAVGTLGLDQRWMRVGLFAASAGIAGLAGGLFAGLRGTIVSEDFIYFKSLLVLLMAVLWGITTVSGALAGGVFMMMLLNSDTNTQGVLFLLLGAGAIIVARWEPNGLVNFGFKIPRLIQDKLYPMLAERYPGMAIGSRDEAEELIGDTGEIPAVKEEVDSDALAAR